MQNQNEGCRKFIIAGGIWLSCGFVNIILSVILTGIIGGFVYMVYFGLPLTAMMLTTALMDLGDAAKEIKSMVKKGDEEDDSSSSSTGRPKNYGKTALPVSVMVFLIGGFITSFWAESLVRHLAIFAGLGVFWGMVWYQLLQRGYMNHRDF